MQSERVFRVLFTTAVAVNLISIAMPIAPAWADERPELSIYGFVRLDFIVEDAPTSSIQEPMYVLNEPDAGGDVGLSLHPRSSRIGLRMDDWDVMELDANGRVEADFQGSSDIEGGIRVRHLYFSLATEQYIELLAGHTWDLMSPLFPSANIETMMWNAGNTGDRRPQLRVSFTPTQKHRFAMAMAMNGLVSRQDADASGRRDGEESGVPMFQWLLEYRTRLFSDYVSRFGVWGHVGEDELSDGTEYRSWSFGAHVFLAVTERVTLLGELFHGKNLNDIRGGIDQGINLIDENEIRATGGWLELAYVPSEQLMFAFGGTIDDPDGEDLRDGDRTRNSTIYAVARLRPSSAFLFGFEYTRWNTSYLRASSVVANRYNAYLSMSF